MERHARLFPLITWAGPPSIALGAVGAKLGSCLPHLFEHVNGALRSLPRGSRDRHRRVAMSRGSALELGHRTRPSESLT